MLGVSLRTAQLWSESGLLEAWKTGGGHRRISRDSVDRLLATPKVRSATQRGCGDVEYRQRSLSILVVEDEGDLRRLYEIVLSGWDIRPRVISVAEGYEALVRVGLDRPDMVITDLRMPGMDGFQMIRVLRSTPELRDTVIAVVTGLDPDEIEDRGGLPAGIHVFGKPIPFDQLCALANDVGFRKGGTDSSRRNAS